MHVADILQLRTFSQVFRIDTLPIIAGVQDVECGHVPVVNGEADTVSIVGLAVDAERPIAFALRAASPFPTFIVSAFVHLAPEVSYVLRGQLH